MSIFNKLAGLVSDAFPPARFVRGLLGLVKDKTGEDLSDMAPEIQQLLIERDTARDRYTEETMQVELETRARTIEAEMAQGDTYTKRARPTLVYSGLLLFFLEFGVRAFLLLRGLSMPEGTIVPVAFTAGWTTAVSVWFVGRSYERGARTKE
jgi:hypothetical protein